MGPRVRGDDRNADRVRTPIHFSNSPSRSRGAFLRPGFATLLRSPESRGGRSAERRSGARRNTRGACHLASKTRVNALMTRQARRLRGALRPIARQDARERAYDAGRSPLCDPPWRFWAPGAALPSPWAPAVLQRRAVASGSVQRAPRTQVVVPGGRGPCLPRRAVPGRRRRTPRLAPPSGSSPETPLDERGCESI